MNTKYIFISNISTAMYGKGCPVILAAGRLFGISGDEAKAVQLKCQNIGVKTVETLSISVMVYDACAKLLLEKAHTYSGISAACGAFFADQESILLGDVPAARFTVAIQRIVFSDKTVWENEANHALEAVALQPPLQDALGAELYSVYTQERNRFGFSAPAADYLPLNGPDYWQCACGQVNAAQECIGCGMNRGWLFNYTRPEVLETLRKAYGQQHTEASRTSPMHKRSTIGRNQGERTAKKRHPWLRTGSMTRR